MRGDSMKKIFFILFVTVLLFAASGYASEAKHHKTSMPNPASFNAHFGDMDIDGDDLVNWKELKSYFPQATPDIFKALDLNADTKVDHDEWHEFKEAHGMRDHD